MDWRQHIETIPDVACGKPIFKGTRITVEFVLERLGQGATEVELVDSYIGLKPEHIRAAQSYAAAVLRNDELIHST